MHGGRLRSSPSLSVIPCLPHEFGAIHKDDGIWAVAYVVQDRVFKSSESRHVGGKRWVGKKAGRARVHSA